MSPPGRRLRVSKAGPLAGCLALLALVAPTAAQGEDSAAPTFRTILAQMTETLESAKQLSFHAELSFDEAPIPGLLVQLAGAMDVALRRADGLRVQYRDDLGAKTLWYDGKTLTLLDWGAGVAASETAPPDLDRAIEEFEKRHGLTLPLAELLAADADEALLARALRGTYVGLHDVEGVACHHLAFLQDNVDWEIWVDSGKVAVPRKLLIRHKQERGSPQYVAVFMDWNLDAQLPDATFRADVPPEAVAVEFLEIAEASE
jgi:hypothetical protein